MGFSSLKNRGDLKQAAENDELLIRYLLGELSEEEQERIEQRYISDPEFYEQLLTVEDDLIDVYAEGALSQSRRERFEDHFLRSPERQARVGFAKAWIAYVSRQSKSARAEPAVQKASLFGFLRFERWPVAVRITAALVLLLGGAFLVAETLRLRSRLQQTESQRAALENGQQELKQQIEAERQRGEELLSELQREREAHDSQTNNPDQKTGIISFFLSPGLVRGTAQAKRLVIQPETRQVRLQVSFDKGDYNSYGVIIKTVDGREIWRKFGLRAQSKGPGKVVVVTVPAGVFSTEDYILALSGFRSTSVVTGLNLPNPPEGISDYFFGASKK